MASHFDCKHCGGGMMEVTQVAPSASIPGILVLACSRCGKTESVLLSLGEAQSTVARLTFE
jgi:hypothetical protein